jgi:hypothetical protein
MIVKNARLLAPASALVALAFATGQPAFAATNSPLPSSDITLPAGLGCEFELVIHSSDGKVHEKDFFDKNGNKVRNITVKTGVVLTYTNGSSDKSVSIKTSGSVSRTVYNADGSSTVTSTGHNGLILFPTDVPTGPSTTQYTGRIVYTVSPSPEETFTLISHSGPARDICSELGG